ncbi:MAG: YihA family ribosome biogenesis GTP-binding protein [Clostridia bacterium]|nr:YihA family ribosome biogenesis GTP-binding protein [Clostridia bacterium]
MLNTQNTVLAMTAGLPTQFPKDGLTEVALSGRSNVGKSSLINTVLGRKNFARVSSAPGKTITINFFNIDKKLYLVDLPGYGYAKRNAEEQKKFSGLTDTYLRKHTPKLIIQLVDLKAGATADDRMMFDFMNRSGIPYVIAATKCDKLNKTDRAAHLRTLAEDPLLNPPEAANKIDIIPFSSLTGEGKAELLALLSSLAEK